jgi:non-ribosomal peptide synthetase component F
MPLAGRNRLETESLIGFFVNTLALRVDVAGDPELGELLLRVRAATLGAYAHQDLPFEKLVTELVTERNLSHAPLLQVMLVLQNAPKPTLALPGLTLSNVEGEWRTAKLDLVLNLTETAEGLAGIWIYNTDLFDSTTVSRFEAQLRSLLASMAASPYHHVSELPILGEGERHQLLVGWNDSAVDLPRGISFLELFAAQAGRRPDSLATSDEREAVTYGELLARADRVASRLVAAGLAPEEPVAVWMERGVDRDSGDLQSWRGLPAAQLPSSAGTHPASLGADRQSRDVDLGGFPLHL